MEEITMVMSKSYSELKKLKTFDERFDYLKTNWKVGDSTFGYDRIFYQQLLQSTRWKKFRDKIIARDNGCDLGIPDRPIPEGASIEIHHINNITMEDILENDEKIFDENNVISCTSNTHKAIHYSNKDILVRDPITRTPNDTCPWKK
jgi:hypothetical protein